MLNAWSHLNQAAPKSWLTFIESEHNIIALLELTRLTRFRQCTKTLKYDVHIIMLRRLTHNIYRHQRSLESICVHWRRGEGQTLTQQVHNSLTRHHLKMADKQTQVTDRQKVLIPHDTLTLSRSLCSLSCMIERACERHCWARERKRDYFFQAQWARHS